VAHKLKVILQRIEAKDYRDIAAMLKYGMRLDEAMAGACALFGKTFQPSESLKALVYFEGGDLDALFGDERAVLVSAVKRVKNTALYNSFKIPCGFVKNQRPQGETFVIIPAPR
jgi:hypothetical protein